jgi:putative transposase
MDGRGRALDNVFVERLWRTVKQEHVHLHDYAMVWEVEEGLAGYFGFYNTERPHSRLEHQTPREVYTKGRSAKRGEGIRREEPLGIALLRR